MTSKTDIHADCTHVKHVDIAETLIALTLRIVLLAMLGLTTTHLPAASITIITHGMDIGGQIYGTPNWEDNMADAIASRIDPIGNGASVSQYSLHKEAFLTPTLTKVKGPNPGTGLNQMDVIIKVDWISVSSLLSPSTADGVGREIANTLLNTTTTDGTYSRSFVELPLHFIGHSRGAYVNSAAIQALGKKGILVDHCTILDGENYFFDGTLAFWSNIKFGDNYFQSWNGWLDGFAVPGFLSFDLSGIAGMINVVGTIGAHGRVHTYYHGTIDTTASTDGDYTIQRADCWYPSCAGPGVQPVRGFYFSRHVPDEYAKSDHDAGLGQFFGGIAAQEIIQPNGPQWPNIVLQNRDNTWKVQAGEQVRIHYPYWDTDSACTITFASDNDQNPYNNSSGNEVDVKPVNPTDEGHKPKIPEPFKWFPNLSHNDRYLYAKITENSGLQRTRYYYLPQKFTVTAAPLPPPPPPPLPPTVGTDLTRAAALRWDDRAGDGDGIPEAGERLGLQISLRNTSSSVVRYVRGYLTTSSPSVQIIDPDIIYGDLNPDQSSYSGSDFDLKLNFAATTTIPFTLRADYIKGDLEYYRTWTFNVTFYANGELEPRFVVDSVRVDDAPPRGNGDGIAQSGENPDLYPRLKNIGNANAIEVKARVENPTFVKFQTGWEDYPNLPVAGPAQEANLNNDIDLDEHIPNGFAGKVYANLVVGYASTNEQIIYNAALLDVKPAAWIKVSPETFDFGVKPTTSNVVFAWTIQNTGTTNMSVTAITSTNADTTWSGDVLPWNIGPGDAKTITVTVTTSGLQGPITRALVVTSTGRIRTAGEDDRVVITGLVGDSVPILQIPNVTGADNPDISGDWIVWSDASSGNSDVYAYNLGTGEKRQITTNTNSQASPRISGNLIVWEDNRNKGTNSYSDVYAYDLSRPDLGNLSVAPGLSPGRSKLLGVDSNRVAFFHVYEWLYDTSSPDAANNLYVFNYQGNGVFSQSFTTGFAPGSGTQARPTVNGPDHGSDGDFGEGLLTFEQGEVYWFASTSTWQERNWTIRAINYAAGGTAKQIFANRSWSQHSAAANRVAFRNSDVNGDDQVWLWQEPGTVQQMTFSPGFDPAGDVLGLGGSPGSELFVYNYNSASRPGLYYLDRTNGQEYLISTNIDSTDLRMDGFRIVFNDNLTPGFIKFAFLKQPDLSITTANIRYSNTAPIEGDLTDVEVTVNSLTKYGVTNAITVRLFDGDPHAGGVQLGSDRVITNGLAALSSAQITFNAVPAGAAGTHQIYAYLTTALVENPANNKAAAPLTVAAVPKVVSLTTLDPVGFETGSKSAVVAVNRTGSTNAPLTVQYVLGGTASNGTDYALLPGSITIPAGAASATLLITPIDDALAELSESVVLTLATNAAYLVGAPSQASLLIKDNDSVPTAATMVNQRPLTNGTFQFTLSMEQGRVYTIDVSTNLPFWTPLLTNTAPLNVFDFIDASSMNYSQRFYRVTTR